MQNVGVLQQIWYYEMIGSMLLMGQNAGILGMDI